MSAYSQTNIQGGDKLSISVTPYARSGISAFWTINVFVHTGETTTVVHVFSETDPGPLLHSIALKAVAS